MKKKFFAIGIKYETDGLDIPALPKNMVVECWNEDQVVDIISNKTGWLVESVSDIRELVTIR